ncbi:nucleotidyltransferase family protein [Bradyrhizobium manausense]|uniref:nucleotidyltransferase family protein n=1 Tax=Bradyrhizobium manausense TaxID=989370 RepID=UPI001BACADF1|nr:nucleotidyltransferase family protein [Bradyrhizobium manausense]MBR0826176.1 nucleotidyltransferase family protein [Bradyrhizobium manausense]
MSVSWDSHLIEAQTSIFDAMRVIGEGRLQIVVVHENSRLLGAATDGDIRRGILARIPLEAPISEIMNRKPITATIGITDEAALALMRRHSIHQLPLVDRDNIIHDIKFLDDLLQVGQLENWVVLMAGGLGTRLRPLTEETPKPLIKIGGRPILETIIRNFVASGFSKFYLAVNYKAEMIEDYFGNGTGLGVEIRYLRENARLGTAGALSLLPEIPSRPFFVMNADLLTSVNFRHVLNYHVERKAPATICVREHKVTVPFGVVLTDQYHLTAITEKPTYSHYVNAGVYVLEPEALKLIEAGKPLDMPNLLQGLIQQGRRPAVFPVSEYWMDVGQLDDLHRASLDFEEIFGK